MPTMLPAAPKTLGRLSDVFVSALGAITGKSNRLALPRVNKAVVILVDGLGSENIRDAAGHAPFLNAALKVSKSLNTVFPTTTAAAISSFGLGLSPSEHGVFGYSVFDRSANAVRNLLSGWDESFKPEDFQPHMSIASRAHENGVRAFTVGPVEYDGSGFTRLNMTGSEYVPARSFDDRRAAVKAIATAKHKSITYLYFPELDSIAHGYGVASREWLSKVEDLDACLRELCVDLPKDVGVIVTADHGVVDVSIAGQIMLDELDIPGLLAVTGDPRNSFLYFEVGIDLAEIKSKLAEQLEDRALVASPVELQELGWFREEISNAQYLPDLFVISALGYACYHRGFAKPLSLKMVGQHGGFTQQELSVPFIKLGAFGF